MNISLRYLQWFLGYSRPKFAIFKKVVTLNLQTRDEYVNICKTTIDIKMKLSGIYACIEDEISRKFHGKNFLYFLFTF